MQRLGLPAEADTAVDPHQAAIALAVAMNEARQDMADKANLRTEALHYGTAKLDALRKRLEPLYAAIPSDVELFDLGLVTPERPRLYVDILSYIEMNRDQTAFRFVQETRTGRITLAETTDEKAIVDDVTRYVAKRLVEREKALATAAPVRVNKLRPEPVEGPKAAPIAGSLTLRHDLGEGARQAEDQAARPDYSAKTLSPGQSTTPLLPKAAPALPMNAEEAFRQWTRPVLETVSTPPSAPAPEVIAPLVKAAEIAVAVPDSAIKDDLLAATHAIAEHPETVAASGADSSAVGARAAAIAAPISRAENRSAESIPSVSMATVRTTPAQLPTIQRSSGGGWLWALLALLIGIGMGALALYLYAANMMR